MKSLFSAVGAVILAFGVSFAAWAAQPLLTPSELDAIRQAPMVRVVDIRPADDYAAGHIPGAVSAPYGQWRGPVDNPGELPSIARLTGIVRGLGVDADTHVVVASAGADAIDFGASARVYWTLKYLGLKNLSILNGGLKAWADAGLPQDQQVVDVSASAFEAHADDGLIAAKERVAAQVGNPRVRLVDARPSDFYLGKTKAPTARVPGTIKGAVSLEYGKWFEPGTAVFIPAAQARGIAAQSLPEQADETITFCNTGQFGAIDWFALSEVAGWKNVRLYPPSLTEWSQDPVLPMDNVPEGES
uniref:sulfurtransferase n=1 Tax=Castellaniella defragrans TaxID=75697 RepID=UPI00334116B3